MRMILSIFNSKKIPYAFIGCLILLLTVDGFVRRHALSLTTISDAIVHYKKGLIESRHSFPYNGLIMGDSRILGLHAKEISAAVTQKTGQPYQFFNYSFPNCGVASYYLLLKKHLHNHPKPDVIVLMISPVALTDEWRLDNTQNPDATSLIYFSTLFNLPEALQALPRRLIPKYLVLKLEQQFHLIYYRKKIAQFLKDPSEYKDRAPWLKRSLSKSNGGALIVRNKPVTEEEIKKSSSFRAVFDVDRDSLHWLTRFFELTQHHNIRVVIANAPLVKQVYEQREANGFNVSYARVIAQQTEQFDTIHTLKPLLESYPIEYYSDASNHLNVRGFKKLTEELGVKLGNALLINAP